MAFADLLRATADPEQLAAIYAAVPAEEWATCQGPRVAISLRMRILASGHDDVELIQQAEAHGESYFLDWHRDHQPAQRLT